MRVLRGQSFHYWKLQFSTAPQDPFELGQIILWKTFLEKNGIDVSVDFEDI
jgi:hypothetical protein